MRYNKAWCFSGNTEKLYRWDECRISKFVSLVLHPVASNQDIASDTYCKHMAAPGEPSDLPSLFLQMLFSFPVACTHTTRSNVKYVE